MGKIKNSRVPITLLYIALFILGGLSRNMFGFTTSSLSAFIYCLMLAIWFHDVRRRILADSVTTLISAICAFCFYLLIARTIKYSLVFEVPSLWTLSWYLPSVGVMQISTLLLLLACEIGEPEQKGFRLRYVLAVPGDILNILILTNDFHQLAYHFNPDGSYEHGTLYYIYIGWAATLFIASLVIMYRKCSVSPGRKFVWIPVTVLIGSFLLLRAITTILDNITYTQVFKYNWYEIFIAMVVIYIESCMAIGLIPSRSGFDTLLKQSSVAVEIETLDGEVVIRSAAPLHESDDKNIIRRHAAIPGGYICWNDDVTDINNILETILNSENELKEQLYLFKAENKLNNKEEEYTVTTALYDDITRAVEPQVDHIEKLLSKGDPDFSELVIYGVFVKRKANLMIVAADNNTITMGELYLSLKDALEYLKLRGIEVTLEVKGTDEDLNLSAPSSVVISLFDGYERYIEENLNKINKLKVSIAPGQKPQLHIDAVCGKEEESYVLS